MIVGHSMRRASLHGGVSAQLLLWFSTLHHGGVHNNQVLGRSTGIVLRAQPTTRSLLPGPYSTLPLYPRGSPTVQSPIAGGIYLKTPAGNHQPPKYISHRHSIASDTLDIKCGSSRYRQPGRVLAHQVPVTGISLVITYSHRSPTSSQHISPLRVPRQIY